jgi:hypothetical protein
MFRIVSRHLSAAASDSPANRTLTKLALALVLTTSAAAVAARGALSSGEGLVAQYFRNVDWSGEPALTAVDTLLSTDQLAQDWPDAPPVFSVRWRGYLTVWRAGVYRFRLITDDSARLYIDDQLITVNEGVPNQVGQLHLSSGSHRVRITAAHFQGKPALTWLWSLDGSDEARVPAWAVSRRSAHVQTAFLRWLLDLMVTPLALISAIVVAWSVLPTLRRRVVASVNAADSSHAFTEWALLAVGVAVLFFALPHRIYSDGSPRFDALVQLLEQGTLSTTPYSMVGPLVSAPLYYIGKLALGSDWWCARFNMLVLAGGLAMTAWLLRRSVDPAVLRKFLLLMIALSMFPIHVQAYLGEVFTSVLVLIGLAAVVTGRTILGWVAATAGVVNTPGSVIGLLFVVLKRVWDTRRLRHVLAVAAALALIMFESWVRRGGPFVSGYEGTRGATTVLPFSGLPGFSYPFWFGLLSILLSFGKGILFFAPGLLLPVADTAPGTRTLAVLNRYLLLFVAGLVVAYAKWWSWYGGFFWGPRFFLAASIPSSLAIAASLQEPRALRTPLLLGALAALTLSAWVGISGCVFGQATLDICLQDHYALEMLCWYTPEFSALWRPFVASVPLEFGQRVFLAYAVPVYLWLAFPILHVLFERTRRSTVIIGAEIANWRI